jgi:hypothetical protein
MDIFFENSIHYNFPRCTHSGLSILARVVGFSFFDMIILTVRNPLFMLYIIYLVRCRKTLIASLNFIVGSSNNQINATKKMTTREAQIVVNGKWYGISVCVCCYLKNCMDFIPIIKYIMGILIMKGFEHVLTL